MVAWYVWKVLPDVCCNCIDTLSASDPSSSKAYPFVGVDIMTVIQLNDQLESTGKEKMQSSSGYLGKGWSLCAKYTTQGAIFFIVFVLDPDHLYIKVSDVPPP